jgi:hypothetical protein
VSGAGCRVSGKDKLLFPDTRHPTPFLPPLRLRALGLVAEGEDFAADAAALVE